MEKDKIEALKKSRQHYVEMRDDGEGIPSYHQCACCMLGESKTDYDHEDPCGYCAIADFTGYKECRESPYYGVILALNDYGIKSDEFKAACTLEIKFFDKILASVGINPED